MRTLASSVITLFAILGAVFAPAASAALITDTAISTGSPPMLIINGSDLAAGSAVVTLGQYPPLTVVTQTATQITALLPGNTTLQGTYLITLQLVAKGPAPAAPAYDEAWVTIGSTGPPGPAGTAGQSVDFLSDTTNADFYFTPPSRTVFSRSVVSTGREFFLINYQASVRSLIPNFPCNAALYVYADGKVIGGATQSTPQTGNFLTGYAKVGWSELSGAAAFEPREAGNHEIRLDLAAGCDGAYRWPALTITKINR